MRCPKCQFDHPLQTIECLKCGIVFSRYQAPLESAANQVHPAAAVAVSAPPALGVSNSSALAGPATAANDAHRGSDDLGDVRADARADARAELKYRLLALPAALLLARLVAGTPLRMAAAMLAMVLHESGHAITAWLTGRWAVPLPWVTPHGQERSWLIVLLVTAAIGFAGFLAWKMERPGWLLAAAGLLVLQLIALSSPAEAMIIFFGDGGALVLATILMATFYAPRESRLYKSWGLRWGLLAIGALSFMHVFLMWRGPLEDLPFGEIEGVNLSDPSLLTEMYGWTVLQMVDRYVRLGTFCLLALLALYIWGLVSAYVELRRSPAA
jgi:hypothetical protein